MLQAVSDPAGMTGTGPQKTNTIVLNLIAFCRTSNGTKWIILQRRPKLVTRNSKDRGAAARISGPEKDQLQIFRQEYDDRRTAETISSLAKRFYRGSLTPEIVQRALRLRSFSNEKRIVYVFPFVIPADQLYFDGHLYEPAPLKDVSVLIESDDVHDSSVNLLSKLDLENLYNMAFETTPPYF